MEYLIGMRIGVRRRKQKVHKPRTTYLSLTEEECLQTVHLPRQVVTDICHLLARELSSKSSSCPYSIPVAVRVMAALHFFATGAIQHPLSSTGGISQSAVSAAISTVSLGLVRHASEFIRFPNTTESRAQVKKQFMDKFGFPDVLGVIDCTHVVLRAPEENSVSYINGQGTYSVNIQVICDASCNFTHVYAYFPGSTADSSILEKSVLPTLFQEDASADDCLLGDTAYPLKTWLLTPFSWPKTKPELTYNIKHLEAFSVMERAVVMLKKRFRCLDKPVGKLQYSPQKVGAFFVASCVLHNLALRHGCQLDIDEDTIKEIRKVDNGNHLSIDEPTVSRVALLKRVQVAQGLCEK